MKWLNNIFSLISDDKYKHCALSSMITSLTVVVLHFSFDFKLCVVLISLLVVFAIGLFKEFVVDDKHDWYDMLANTVGYIIVIVPYIISTWI